MARSKFVWLVVYETGEVQFVKAQTVWQILTCDLIGDSDSIIYVSRIELSDSYIHPEAIDIPFQD